MGIFDRWKKGNTADAWRSAYIAKPQFYAKPDGAVFGAFALTEETETVFPKAPHYAINGKAITEYRLMIVSTSKHATMGDCDYFAALQKLEPYQMDSNAEAVLIRGLSFAELEGVKE